MQSGLDDRCLLCYNPHPMHPFVTTGCSAIHFTALTMLSLYGIHRFHLLRQWQQLRSSPPEQMQKLPVLLPMVTVQLPLYNERFVVERLLDAAAHLDWPVDRLEIQVLDDSSDDTSTMVDERASFWCRQGIAMTVVRRSGRAGYKAGALAAGLTMARGEFIAIFDADFIPPRQFLRETIPYFADTGVGMVQACWGFCNAANSWLTRVQSLLLSPHFGIEHLVRFRRGLFFNFNGTAGVWRRQAISDAGGWQADTVTEDLDLSYRAQLAGWRFVYRDDLRVPSELPVTLASFRSQQQRWAKGSIQTARKLLPRLLSSSLPLSVKTEAVAHLLANVGWLAGTLVTLTLYPTVIARAWVGPYQLLRLDLPLFLGTTVIIVGYFLLYGMVRGEKGTLSGLPLVPVLAVGLAPSIALSVVKGMVSDGGVFERTPKFGIRGRSRLPGLAFLYRQRSLWYLMFNTALFLYTLLPLQFAWERGTWFALPLFALFPAGFLLSILKETTELFQSAH